MKSFKSSRPSPALVLAALALVFAMVGTAVAGPDAISDKITKKKVKKISKKQINKAAPNLSVANADTVDGFPAEGLVRSAFSQVDDDARVGPIGPGPILTTTIAAPTSGYLLINAGSDVFGDPSFGTCGIEVDGSEIDSSFRTWELGVDNEEEDCTTETTVAVAAGTRTVVFEDLDGVDDGALYDEAELQVLFVPFGSTGAQPNSAAKADSRGDDGGSASAGN